MPIASQHGACIHQQVKSNRLHPKACSTILCVRTHRHCALLLPGSKSQPPSTDTQKQGNRPPQSVGAKPAGNRHVPAAQQGARGTVRPDGCDAVFVAQEVSVKRFQPWPKPHCIRITLTRGDTKAAASAIRAYQLHRTRPHTFKAGHMLWLQCSRMSAAWSIPAESKQCIAVQHQRWHAQSLGSRVFRPAPITQPTWLIRHRARQLTCRSHQSIQNIHSSQTTILLCTCRPRPGAARVPVTSQTRVVYYPLKN